MDHFPKGIIIRIVFTAGRLLYFSPYAGVSQHHLFDGAILRSLPRGVSSVQEEQIFRGFFLSSLQVIQAPATRSRNLCPRQVRFLRTAERRGTLALNRLAAIELAMFTY